MIKQLHCLVFIFALATNVMQAHTQENEHQLCRHSMRDVQMVDISSPTNYIPQSFDVLSYNLYLDLRNAPTPKTDDAYCDISYKWVNEPDVFRFHLRDLKVDSVVDLKRQRVLVANAVGTRLDPTFHYEIIAQSGSVVGDTERIRVYYSGTMTPELVSSGSTWGGVQQSSDKKGFYAMGVGFRNNYVSATSHWMPCYDHPSDKATFSATFVVHYPYAVASNGTLELTPGGATALYKWSTNYPVATYLLTFACDEYTSIPMGKSNTVPLEVWSRMKDTTATKKTFSLLPQMVDYLSNTFAPYPFEKVGYVNTDKGAMEHQTMVSFPTFLSQRGDTLNQTGFHELAHQWFGDAVTPYDFRDAWLNESFATFCETLWHEKLFGSAGYAKEMQKKVDRYLAQLAKKGNAAYEGVLPLYDFPRATPSSNYPETIYQKGAVVLGMLRAYVGDEVFFASLKDYYNTNKYKNATIDSVVNAFLRNSSNSQHSGIRSFFAEWVKGRGWAVLSVRAEKYMSNNVWKARLFVDQVQADSLGLYSVLPIEFTFKGSSSTSTKYVLLQGRNSIIDLDDVEDFSTVSINSGTKVRSLALLQSAPTVSVSNEATPTIIDVFPNPADSFVRVDQKVAEYIDCVIVNNETGVVVQKISLKKGENVIPITNLPSGVYSILGKTQKQRVEQRFIIQR